MDFLAVFVTQYSITSFRLFCRINVTNLHLLPDLTLGVFHKSLNVAVKKNVPHTVGRGPVPRRASR